VKLAGKRYRWADGLPTKYSYEGARGPPMRMLKGPVGPPFDCTKGPTGPQLIEIISINIVASLLYIDRVETIILVL
jgi:hypothetical protein